MRPCLALLVLVLLAPAASRADQPPAELESLRRAIEERRERVAEYERRERGLFEAIQFVDEAIRALSVDLDRARREASSARDRLRALKASSAELEVRLAGGRRKLEIIDVLAATAEEKRCEAD